MDRNDIETQVSRIVQLQNELNTMIYPDWRYRCFKWGDAIWCECAELMDQLDFKWWKSQEIDIEQVYLEIIDILHFGVSFDLQTGGSNPVIIYKYTFEFEKFLNRTENDKVDEEEAKQMISDNREKIFLAIRQVARSALSANRFDLKSFIVLMELTGLSFEKLVKTYCGKNILNIFRQNHGYNDGTYNKVWNNKQDNQVLAEIIDQYPLTHPSFVDEIYNTLSDEYATAEYVK